VVFFCQFCYELRILDFQQTFVIVFVLISIEKDDSVLVPIAHKALTSLTELPVLRCVLLEIPKCSVVVMVLVSILVENKLRVVDLSSKHKPVSSTVTRLSFVNSLVSSSLTLNFLAVHGCNQVLLIELPAKLLLPHLIRVLMFTLILDSLVDGLVDGLQNVL
jgi:hypothetical protein